MTLQEALNKVAQKHGQENWARYRERMHDNGLLNRLEDRLIEAAEIYAEAKWDEACAKQADIMRRIQEEGPHYRGGSKPEFKA